MKKNYKWGILGAGKIANKFCQAMSVVEGGEVYAVASREIEKAKEFGEKFDAKKCYGSYEELVRDEEVDIVYIATPHVFHFEQTLQCFEKNKHVLCEKPLTVSARQTAELIRKSAEKNLFLMEGMWTLCMPFAQKIRETIASGKIGKVRCVSAEFGFASEKDPKNRIWNKELGGGSLLDVGVYNIFLATTILGDPSEIKSLAKISETGIDEYVNLVMNYSSGATAQSLSSVIYNTDTDASIFGEKGRIVIKDPWSKATDLIIYANYQEVETFSKPHDCNGFEYEIREAMRCLDAGERESPLVPHHLSLSVSKIMDQVLEQTGYRTAS